LARGQISKPEWHKEDDHQIHITEHRAFMTTQRWELLPERIQKIFANHVQMHRTYQAENRAKEIQMAGMEARAEQASGPMDMSGMGGPPNQQREGPPPAPPSTPTGGGPSGSPEFNPRNPIGPKGEVGVEESVDAIMQQMG
jgi:hypothetical protein